MTIIRLCCILVSTTLLASCITIDLKGEVQRAKQVSYSAPDKPFESINSESADQAWQNSRNGNSISYYSHCSSDSDPPLELLRNDALSGIENLKLISNEQEKFNSRKALNVHSTGTVDGVDIGISLIIFKKNSCHYILTYTGIIAEYQKNLSQFQQFQKTFEAQ